VISVIVLLPRKFHSWLVPSIWVITRASDRKPKPTKWKRAVPSIKDKQILIISGLDKGEKGINLAQEFGISKQQIFDILWKNKDKILKFTVSIETSKGLTRESTIHWPILIDILTYTWLSIDRYSVEYRPKYWPIFLLIYQSRLSIRYMIPLDQVLR